MEKNPIQIWYGPIQRFGQLGRPQRWINVLGNIAADAQVEKASYALNGGDPRPLTLGGDLHRLARSGDFNVELSWDEVQAGDNTLVISADTAAQTCTSTVRLIVDEPRNWPLPYSVDFATAKNLQDLVQIVDGLWHLKEDGVRTAEPYYDRVLNLGDDTWTNYQTTLRLTVHDFTPSTPGPPTYGVTHFGVAMRWRGHHTDGLQPRRQWYPLGAQGEFLLKEGPQACQWRILFDRPADKAIKYADGRNTLTLGRPIRIKSQIATLPDGRSRYRFKAWDDDRPEPPGWDVEGLEADDYPSGSLCLVPHNSDVTIHQLAVTPLPPG